MKRTPRTIAATITTLVALAGVAVALWLARGGDQPKLADGLSIRTIEWNDGQFEVAEVDLRKASLRLVWRRADGSRLANLAAAEQFAARSGRHALFATNAGIFDPTYTPLGLHVEDGKALHDLNLADGTGNFFLKPNGVFFLDARGARIEDATKFDGQTAGLRLATQSGPLLLSNGVLNPTLNANSPNRKVRSGVGLRDPDHVVFALSRGPVTFYELGTLFRDHLHCPDALYLDGVISRFHVPGADGGSDGDFAGMLVVTSR